MMLRGGDSRLAGLEHLHRSVDHVADRVDARHVRLHPPVRDDPPVVAHLDAQHPLQLVGGGPFAEAEEHAAVAVDRHRLGALEDRHAALAHPVDDVVAQVLVDVVQRARPHHGRTRHHRRLAPRGVEERPLLHATLLPPITTQRVGS
jgi:hypothetical protein